MECKRKVGYDVVPLEPIYLNSAVLLAMLYLTSRFAYKVITALVVAFLLGVVLVCIARELFLEEPERVSTGTAESPRDARESSRRRSLLLFGHDRSGTTLLSKMFDSDSRVFGMYEPFWTTHWDMARPTFDEKVRLARDVLTGFLSCNFSASENGVDFLRTFRFRLNDGRSESRALTAKHFRNGTDECMDLSLHPNYTDWVCQNRYKYSVVKIATPRIPDTRIAGILPRLFEENPHTDIKAVHIVRDPRGNVHSRIKLEWFRDHPDPRFENSVKQLCDEIMPNVQHLNSLLSKYGERIMIIRYKEIADDPVGIAKRLYKFAGFEISDEVLDWVKRGTTPSKKTLERELEHPYSHVRNATGNAERWRKDSPIERVRVIERVCEPLMRILGLEKMETLERN
ncbi:carbohydrate sulfotransferase 3 [Nematostella vectensis]|uniref:carbohydrate sulfotransferase 3 n=1 Tax=Nematostella vectensis TaxID=45351 RepID=UPI002076DB6D|nr:carbohydrate sulfotransferase 3 [Nematostella vectensis]